MEKLKRLKCLNALTLKIIAMALMLCDHAWATVVPDNNWLTYIGRLAFPIFAFQLVEGFFQTHDWKGYLKRMFLWALVSELPFNLMVGGGPIYPFHQNVLFTFCEGLLLMRLLELARQKGTACYVLASIGCVLLGFVVGTLTMVDYNGYGIWMILLFYFCHGKSWGWMGQLAGMVAINCYLMGGLVFPVTIWGMDLNLPEQGLAVLALPLIWLYNGKQGPHSKAIRNACYAFYPAHILLLDLIGYLMPL